MRIRAAAPIASNTYSMMSKKFTVEISRGNRQHLIQVPKSGRFFCRLTVPLQIIAEVAALVRQCTPQVVSD